MTNVDSLKKLCVLMGGADDVSQVEGETVAEVVDFLAEHYPVSVPIGTLTVTSAAGASFGTTKVTVTPAPEAGATYAYKVSASSITAPARLSVPEGVTAWDGTSEITAEDGHKIGIYELNSAGQAVRFGQATVRANLG